MKSFYLTDTGKVRDHNEDSVIIVRNNENSWDRVAAARCHHVVVSVGVRLFIAKRGICHNEKGNF